MCGLHTWSHLLECVCSRSQTYELMRLDGGRICGRDRQSLEGTVKRAAAAGVLLFGDVFACHASSLPETELDEWWGEQHRSVSGPTATPQLEKTLEEIDVMIEEEYDLWKESRESLKKQRPDIKIKGAYV